jgi:hypothetical protein
MWFLLDYSLDLDIGKLADFLKTLHSGKELSVNERSEFSRISAFWINMSGQNADVMGLKGFLSSSMASASYELENAIQSLIHYKNNFHAPFALAVTELSSSTGIVLNDWSDVGLILSNNFGVNSKNVTLVRKYYDMWNMVIPQKNMMKDPSLKAIMNVMTKDFRAKIASVKYELNPNRTPLSDVGISGIVELDRFWFSNELLAGEPLRILMSHGTTYNIIKAVDLAGSFNTVLTKDTLMGFVLCPDDNANEPSHAFGLLPNHIYDLVLEVAFGNLVSLDTNNNDELQKHNHAVDHGGKIPFLRVQTPGGLKEYPFSLTFQDAGKVRCSSRVAIPSGSTDCFVILGKDASPGPSAAIFNLTVASVSDMDVTLRKDVLGEPISSYTTLINLFDRLNSVAVDRVSNKFSSFTEIVGMLLSYEKYLAAYNLNINNNSITLRGALVSRLNNLRTLAEPSPVTNNPASPSYLPLITLLDLSWFFNINAYSVGTKQKFYRPWMSIVLAKVEECLANVDFLSYYMTGYVE